jgi:hypothetical protein
MWSLMEKEESPPTSTTVDKQNGMLEKEDERQNSLEEVEEREDILEEVEGRESIQEKVVVPAHANAK